MITRKNYLIFIKIYHFYQKEKTLIRKTYLQYRRQKEKYVVHIKALKKALNHGLILKKVHIVIKFNQRAWLKPYVDMNTKLRIKTNNEFEKKKFKLMVNSVFGKTMENLRKHRDIKLVTTDEKRSKLVSEPNHAGEFTQHTLHYGH